VSNTKCLHDLAIAKADGSYAKLMNKLAKSKVLVIDDLGLAPMTESERRDLLEVIEDRHGLSSTIVARQLPIESWHDIIGDPTIADAILDRLVHNAHKINLKGESMRKKHLPLTNTNNSEK
jgi:DNA replication protein DnaC